MSRVAINGIKGLAANMLLLCNNCVETSRREQLLGSAMADKIEESILSLDLDKKLEKNEQKLNHVVEDSSCGS